MKSFLIALLLTTILSCSKDSNKEYCYECDLQMNGNYQDAGCMTEKDWETVQFTDFNGNGQLDKSRYCRKK
jgi:hypothetical protein